MFQNSKCYGLLLTISIIGISCSTGKYATTNKVYKDKANDFADVIKEMPPVKQQIDSLPVNQQTWVGSVNFGMRKPNFVIIHHTAQDSLEQTIRTFTIARTQTSAHYVIGKDGKVVQMVNDYLRANHAGVGRWGNDTDLNSSSIGIELDNNGLGEPYSEALMASLIKLLGTLKQKYNIPTANFIGHADIAPGRKTDPYKFPWKQLADHGFGIWQDGLLIHPTADFDPVMALRVIGYDTRNLSNAIKSFKLHFVQTDENPVLSDDDKLILYNLYTKFL